MKRKMIYSILLVVALLLCWQGYEFWVAVGRQPRGERLERCKQSPQWRDGEFVNVHETPTLTGDDGFFGQMYKFLFGKVGNLRPDTDVPTAKSLLKDIPRSEEICVWLGHSTVYIQTGGMRFLFDPVLTNRLPVWWFMRPFKGADVYTVDDIPEVDYLVITHDHWDHLDWKTVTALKDRVGQVVCALGIGEHFEYWGYDPQRIHDLDWQDSVAVSDSITLRCLPTRHFSGNLEDPRITTFILISKRVSSSHSFFTASLQLSNLCTSSMTSRNSGALAAFILARAVAHISLIQKVFVLGTLSALTDKKGMSVSCSTCLTIVDLPT